MNSGLVRIGTRGSMLALAQTKLVAEAISAKLPAVRIETVIITTKGDVNHEPIPADMNGKTWFTAEIEDALLQKRIDVAVHSLKDLAPEVPEGLIVMPVLARADARDVLISTGNLPLSELKRSAVVGTDSIRRKALLLRERPDLCVVSIRGNIDTRLRKLSEGHYDAIVLAAAGFKRLGKESVVTEYLDVQKFIPAIGQGVLAAECAEDDAEMIALLASLQDKDTCAAAEAERVFTDIVGGGCKLPIGCYAEIDGDEVSLYGMIGTEDAVRVVTGTKHGLRTHAVSLARDLAEELRETIS